MPARAGISCFFLDTSDTYELKGLVSRKKQLIPALAGMIQQMEEMR